MSTENAVECMEPLSPFAQLGLSLDDFFLGLDIDGNGKLTADEVQAMHKQFNEIKGKKDKQHHTAPLSQTQIQNIFRIWNQDFAEKNEQNELEFISIENILNYIKKETQKLENYIDGYYPSAPIEEIHLALTGDPSEMTVSWSTPEKPSFAAVHWGFSPSNLSFVAVGTTTSYRTHNKLLGLLGLGYFYTGYISHAVLTSIPPQSTIYYSCTNGTAFSPVLSFKSAAGQEKPTRFAALGDQGVFFPAGFKVSQQIAAIPDLDAVFHAGDLAYAGTSGSADGGEFEFVWDWWSRQNQQFAAYVPYMLTVGNHEQFYNFTSFIHRFTMPANGNGNFWYSYDLGFLHVLSFSSEHPYQPGTPQYDFIVADLKNATSRLDQVPWIVVVDHRPIYCSDQDEWEAHNGNPQTSELSQIIEPLLMQFKVPLMISGHMHVFERTYPVYNATSYYSNGENVYSTRYAAPIYITAGSGGIFLDEHWIDPAPAWSAYRASEWGVAIVEANSTTLHYQFETALDRKVKDEFWLNNF